MYNSDKIREDTNLTQAIVHSSSQYKKNTDTPMHANHHQSSAARQSSTIVLMPLSTCMFTAWDVVFLIRLSETSSLCLLYKVQNISSISMCMLKQYSHFQEVCLNQLLVANLVVHPCMHTQQTLSNTCYPVFLNVHVLCRSTKFVGICNDNNQIVYIVNLHKECWLTGSQNKWLLNRNSLNVKTLIKMWDLYQVLQGV